LSGSTTISFSRAVLRAVINVHDDYKYHLRWMPYSIAEICRRFAETYCRKQQQYVPSKCRQFQIHYTASDPRCDRCRQFRSRYASTGTVGHTIVLCNRTVSRIIVLFPQKRSHNIVQFLHNSESHYSSVPAGQ
jgi:hypothetical protein